MKSLKHFFKSRNFLLFFVFLGNLMSFVSRCSYICIRIIKD